MEKYDVLIIGAGFAGVCQARHLLQSIPDIKVALIDPRPIQRGDDDLKIGESMVEIATHLLTNELGLMDYMLENHPPKNGLNFHWPKDPKKTDDLSDYNSIWARTTPPYPTYQLHRSKFETDVLKMCQEDGADFIQGTVIDVDLGIDDQAHELVVRKKGSKDLLSIKCDHVIDCSGKRFVLGKKMKTIVRGKQNLMDINSGSAWVRVRNVDRSVFMEKFQTTDGIISKYYTTNHFFGEGYWFWMIPTDIETREVSIGLIYHPDKVAKSCFENQESFLDFVQQNQNLLRRLIDSGEIVDYHHYPLLPYTSNKVFSQDRWYIQGDAAAFFDAFYSNGTSLIAFSVLSITELIRSKMSGESDFKEKVQLFDKFYIEFLLKHFNTTFTEHTHHLGKMGLMSWRISWDTVMFFHILVPTFMGKWFLNTKFIETLMLIYPFLYRAQRNYIDILTNHALSEKPDVEPIEPYRFLLFPLKGMLNFFAARASVGIAPFNIIGSLPTTIFSLSALYSKQVTEFEGKRALLSKHHLKTLADLTTAWTYAKAVGKRFDSTKKLDVFTTMDSQCRDTDLGEMSHAEH